jgi:regulatory protein
MTEGASKPARRRPPPPLSEAMLERAALGYLERFDSTARKLRDVLMRRVRKSARAHGEDIEVGRQMVDALLARYCESGLVSDRRYAESMARGLRDRGGSRRLIQAKLRARGVSASDLAVALDSAGVSAEGEFEAARTFARRRRLGPHRPLADREAFARKDMAAMARAGFAFDICRRVLALGPGELDDSR